MTAADWFAIAATVLCGLAILPGSLGVLAVTNSLAAKTWGARLIYDRSKTVLRVSILALAAAFFLSSPSRLSTLTLTMLAGYLAILVFGWLMHTKLMFRPIRKPTFIPIDEAIARFGPDEEVIGITDKKGTPFAFITRLARRPHIVYQPEGDNPFVMTHCILSHSSSAYASEGRFSRPEFAVAAALGNNLVIYDNNNACVISQIQNRTRDGNREMETLPTVATSLKSWKALYPSSKVWVRSLTWRDTFFLKVLSRADVISPSSPKLVYPLQHERDTRLGLKSQVVGVRIGRAAKAYPIGLINQEQTINDTVGDKPILVASSFDGDYIQVFDRKLDGRTLTFRPTDSGEGFVEEASGSRFSATGTCTSGQYLGRRLAAIPHYSKIFWFPWADYFPETEIYSAAAAASPSIERLESPVRN